MSMVAIDGATDQRRQQRNITLTLFSASDGANTNNVTVPMGVRWAIPTETVRSTLPILVKIKRYQARRPPERIFGPM